MIAKGGAAVGVIVLVTIALIGLDTTTLPLSSSVAVVFAGSRGTVAQYLFGMAVLLLPALNFSIAFSLDWHSRAPLLAVRYASLNKWFIRILCEQLLIAVAYGLALLLVTSAVRFGLGPVPKSPVSTSVLSLAIVAVKLVIAEVLFIAASMAAIVLVRADGIWVLALVLLLAAGLLPVAGSDLFPITAWSSEWTGDKTLTAILSPLFAVLFVLTSTFIAANIRKEAGYINGRRRTVRS